MIECVCNLHIFTCCSKQIDAGKVGQSSDGEQAKEHQRMLSQLAQCGRGQAILVEEHINDLAQKVWHAHGNGR